MSTLNNAMNEINQLEVQSNEDSWFHQIHPLVKLVTVVLYIVVTVSFPKNQLFNLLSMAVFPIVVFASGAVSFKKGAYRLRIVLPFVFFMGILNPVFDRQVVMVLGNLKVTSGMLSFVSLVLKGFFTVFASYILVATTSVEQICQALRIIHIPKILVVQILLVYRYITVLLEEASLITQAYLLRAPGQKGIKFTAWGSFIGQLLLRTMDRADEIYESMCLRGFNGDFAYAARVKFKVRDVLFLIGVSAAVVAFRIFPVFKIVGGLFS